ncbi:MAG: serine O-acetyltransferase [Rhodoluna sp.]|nr:serine O-acetyltransferase [Rhodoluna sp.]
MFLTAPGLHAVWMHRVASFMFHKLRWRIVARMFSQWARLITGIEIHPAAVIGRRLFIDHGMGVVIGATAIVGDDVLMYHGVTLGGRTLERGVKRHPTIGNKVVLGAHSIILGDITVGDGAQIGAQAIVTKNVKPGATVIGKF